MSAHWCLIAWKRADRAAELHALLRVRDAEVEAALRAADLLGRERDARAVERALERRAAGALLAEQRRRGHAHVAKRERGEAARLVDRRERASLDAGASPPAARRG